MLLFCFLPPPTTLLLLPITTKTRVQWLRRGARRLPLLPYRGQLRKKDPHTKQTEKRRKINDPIRICHRLSASGRTEKGLQTSVDILLTISEGAQRHLSCLKKNTKKVFYRQEYVVATATYALISVRLHVIRYYVHVLCVTDMTRQQLWRLLLWKCQVDRYKARQRDVLTNQRDDILK